MVAALAIGTEGCSRSAAAEVAPATPTLTLLAEDVATVERSDLAAGPIVSGTVTARRHAVVRAEVGGPVAAMYVDRGSVVVAGAPLLRVGGHAASDAQVAAAADVRTDEDALALAKRRLTRSQALLAGGAIAADEVEDARQAVRSAEAKVAASTARLSAAEEASNRMLMRAPFSGVVSARSVNAGDIVEPGTVLIELLDPSTMYVEGSVPASEIDGVRVGAPIALTVTGYPRRTFAGRIERTSPAADPTTRQIPVFIAIENRDRTLVAGLFAEGRVASGAATTLLVPDDAIERTDTSASVVRFTAGHVERRAVDLGRRAADGTFVEIRAGLALGDTVVLGSSRQMASGTKVRIVGAGAAPTTTPTTR